MPNHTPKDLPFTKELEGISRDQISQHHDVLYVGYVNKLNEIEESLKNADRSKANATYSEIGELKREEIFATNGMNLHEYYFENLGGDGKASGKIVELINNEFGSVEKWQEDFRAAGISARGWVVLCCNLLDGKLHNYSCDVHDVGGVWSCIPLLVLDVYEHAYMIDHGVKRAAYLDAFFKNVNWDVVNKRLDAVLKMMGAVS